MTKNRSSIRFIIVFSFVVLITITFSIGYFVFSNWKASADIIQRQIEKDINQDIFTQIEKFVNEPLNINESNHYLIKNQIVDLNNKEEREKFFAGVLKSTKPEVYSFSYGTANGEYYGARRNKNNEIEIMENNTKTNGKSHYYSVTNNLTSGKLMEVTAKFDPRTRDWYKIAIERNQAAFSPIYKHFVMDDLAISAAYPIYTDNGVLRGVLGTHIVLSNINRYLKVIVDNRATAYIIEKNSGELVANSIEIPNFETIENNNIKRLTIQEIDDQSILHAYQNYRNNFNNKTVVETKNDKIHVTLTDFSKEGLDWLLITAIPESQFTSEMMKTIRVWIYFSVIALVMIIIIYIKSTEIVLRPIYSLISTTEKFSQGDFLQRAKIVRNDEIGKLSDAFNYMAEQLYILINTLEEKVRERTIKLEKANNELRQSIFERKKAENNLRETNERLLKVSEYKSEFLTNMSHELRTPLTAIIAITSGLLVRHAGPITAKQEENLNTVLDCSKELLGLINDLLDLSKAESGKMSLNLTEVKIAKIVSEVIKMVEPLAKGKEIEIQQEIRDDGKVIADGAKVKQVVVNLLGNAIKFSRFSGKVKVLVNSTIEPEEGTFIKIYDSGPGIPENKHDKVFDAFYQVNRGLNKKYKGTGLGLTLVKKIIEMHLGYITVENLENNEGAVFTVFWPAYPAFESDLE